MDDHDLRSWTYHLHFIRTFRGAKRSWREAVEPRLETRPADSSRTIGNIRILLYRYCSLPLVSSFKLDDMYALLGVSDFSLGALVDTRISCNQMDAFTR